MEELFKAIGYLSGLALLFGVLAFVAEKLEQLWSLDEED